MGTLASRIDLEGRKESGAWWGTVASSRSGASKTGGMYERGGGGVGTVGGSTDSALRKCKGVITRLAYDERSTCQRLLMDR